MENSVYEQYGYKSAHDLMTELARDISDGGDLIIVIKHKFARVKMCGWKFDGGYWIIMYRHINRGYRVEAITYLDTEEELMMLMEAM